MTQEVNLIFYYCEQHPNPIHGSTEPVEALISWGWHHKFSTFPWHVLQTNAKLSAFSPLRLIPNSSPHLLIISSLKFDETFQPHTPLLQLASSTCKIHETWDFPLHDQPTFFYSLIFLNFSQKKSYWKWLLESDLRLLSIFSPK